MPALWSAPFAGPEFTPGNPVYIPAPFAQQNATIAFNGSYFLVVWDDKRDQSSHIFATRISTNGTILDPNSLKIDKTPGADGGGYYPAVASDGSSFLIVASGSGRFGASARVLSATGQLTDGFSSLGGYISSTPVAFNGTNYLLVWSTQGGDIYGSRVRSDGTLADAGGFPICTATGTQSSPVVCKHGTNWLVAWSDQRQDAGDIYGTLVTPNASVLVSNGFAICVTNRTQTGPKVANLGDKALVAWSDARNSSLNDLNTIFATRVNLSGQVLDGNGFQTSSGSYEYVGAVASDGQNWMVVSCDQSWTVSRIVTSQGILGAQGLSEFSGLSAPYLEFGGTNYLAVWQTRLGSASWMIDVVARRMSSSGTSLEPSAFPISLANNSQAQPSVAGNGTDYFVVWSDERQGDGLWDIYGARVKRDGTVVDPQGIPVTTLYTAETNPAVAFNGENYLVVWSDSRAAGFQGYVDIYAARVTTNGQVLDTNGFLIARPFTTGTRAAVASIGTNFLVAWDGSSSSALCYGVRVSGAGQVLDPSGIQLYAGGGSAYPPSIAANGTNYLVGWVGYYGGDAVVSPGGAILYSNYPVSGFSSLASNGRAFVAGTQGEYGVTGLMLDASGQFNSYFRVASTYDNPSGYWNAICGNGQDYLVVFSPAHYDSSAYVGNNPVYLSQATAAGRAIYTNGILTFTNSSVLKEMALAANPGNYLLAYTRPNDRRISTLYARILDSTPQLLNPARGAGQFSFVVDGPAEREYELQVSDDLRSWSAVAVQTNVDGTVAFTTNNASPRAFYRAKLR